MFFVSVSQPDQDVLERLADPDVREGLLASASRGKPLDLTRMSWNGRPTWMSRKASLFRRAQGGQSFFVSVSQPDQDVLERLADPDVRESLLVSAGRRLLFDLTRISWNARPIWMSSSATTRKPNRAPPLW